MPYRVPISEESIKQIINLYSVEHLSSADIGIKYGVCQATITRWLKEHNIPVQDRYHNEYKKRNIKADELPSIFKNTKIINHRLTSEVTCPNCGKIRRITLKRPRIKDIAAQNGKCNSCIMKLRIKPLGIELVKNLYLNEHLTAKQIGIKFNVSDMAIRHLLKRHGLEIRKRGELKLLTTAKEIQTQNKGTLESPIVGDICRGIEIGLNDPSYYIRVSCPICKRERWQVKNHSKLSQICKECAVNPRLDNKGTITLPVEGDIQKGEHINKRNGKYYKWVICPECGNKRWEWKGHASKLHLCPTCAHRNAGLKIRGEKCHLWRGGGTVEKYPREFNETLKEQIRKRDNYTCQLCGKPQNGMKLSVHHIDYIKSNCDPTNLISLCPARVDGCHARTNSHYREYWTAYFQDILRVRGIIT